MEKLNYKALSILFNRNFLKKIIKDNYEEYIENLFNENNYFSDEKKILTILDNLYSDFEKNYRCEYIYKNLIARKILIKRHSLDTSVLIPEMYVENSKADIVIFNGTSTVYEIKTELDSLNRLESQLNSYLKCFDKVYIVTTLENIKKLENIIPDKVGLIEVTKRNALKEYKRAKSNKENINKEELFRLLRQNEIINIMKKLGNDFSDTPSIFIRTEGKKIFLTLDNITAHDMAVKEMKTRKVKNEQKELIEKAPESLKFFFLAEPLNKKQCNYLRGLL